MYYILCAHYVLQTSHDTYGVALATPLLIVTRVPERAAAVKVLFMMIARDLRIKVLRRWI